MTAGVRRLRARVLDLATPQAQTAAVATGVAVGGAAAADTARHVVQKAPDLDSTVRLIAKILSRAKRFTPESGDDTKYEIEAIRQLLKRYGVGTKAIRMAIGLTRTESGYRRGTSHTPNARLAKHGATLAGKVREVRDQEVYYRAAYIANAAKRMQDSMDTGSTPKQALAGEQRFYQAHEQARKGRLESAAQVQTAAKVLGQKDDHGTLVGWYLNPLLHNEIECQTADGHNFYAEDGTVIGLPGSVHNRCGCFASAPFEGGAENMVNDYLGNVVRFSGAKPKFKIKNPKRTPRSA